MFFPISLVSFFLLNRLFYLLFNYKISSLLRLYSLWYHLIFILFNQNIPNIVFLSFRHMENLFSFDFNHKISYIFSMLFIGIFLIIIISFYPMSLYQYKKLSKYFLSNLKTKNGSFLIMQVQFCIKPVIQSLLHATLYYKPELQLTLLSCSCFCSLIFIIFMEFK